MAACRAPEATQPAAPAVRPSILLVTLDTTRADAIGAGTPSFNALAARGRSFRQAYAAAPQTLPSHTSMLTGLYPAGHGVHENARALAASHPLAAERLLAAGYRTAAFVSSFSLARRFGLARGFELYDDELPQGRAERSSTDTTDRALRWLAQQQQPVFLWVHYFDPHYPYEPRAGFPGDPYHAEVAAMDVQLGRLVAAFQQHAGKDAAIVVAADHGEGLGEHGEQQHGNLLYQGVMHVPLVIAGPGVSVGVSDTPVSTRRVFHTLLDFAGVGAEKSLRAQDSEVVVGEGMIPFLEFGWQPQVMAVEGHLKVIRDSALEIYDVIADPHETNNLAGKADLPRTMRTALQEYPLPSTVPPPSTDALSEEERRKLASLGYVAADVRPAVRADAPRPRDMTHLFATLDAASGMFVREEYARAIPLLDKILVVDPHNLMAALRLAAAHSALGHDDAALAAFHRAESIAPDSPDVRVYLALHYAKGRDWQRAVPLLERVVAESPDRLPPLEALAALRERSGDLPAALQLRQKIAGMRTPTPAELAHTGELAMAVGDTATAINAFERAPGHDLELGVLYLAARRFEDARTALDRVPATHPAYAMALFKRAQVSVLLHEPDAAARIQQAREQADATTRELIANERLFRQ
ncbi:MAG: choline-sulfatase [Acidobacteriota bacterium]|nr:choline-sulfatase [Acidobacteriota bacterium]